MKVSIITINLNKASSLLRTIESVIKQTYSDFEFIIIDGGSTDGSVDVIKKNESRIDYWISEPDKGIYNAMNKGILVSTGKYLLFLNSGDYLCNERVLEGIFKEKISGEIIYADGFYQRKDRTLKPFVTPENLDLLFIIDHGLLHPSTLISASTFKILGLYNENFKIISDAEFFIKALLKGVIFQKVNLPVAVVEPGGLSQNCLNLLRFEQTEMLKSSVDNDYFKLYLSRNSLIDQLAFFKKSKLLRFLLRHRTVKFYNRLISYF